MSISPLTFGSPVYNPPFSVSSGDTDVLKLRSRETAPLSHESLDENFTNLADKINEILGLGIDDLNIVAGFIQASNLGISAGAGIGWSATGVISHQARQSPAVGYITADLSNNSRRFVQALDFDQFGHVNGYQSGTLNFVGSGSVSVDQTTVSNGIIISSSAYTSGSSPTFNDVHVAGKITFGSDSNHQASLDLYNSSGDTVFDRHWSGGQSNFAIKHNGATQLLIEESGNVGIGTTSPADELHVNSASENVNLRLTRDTNTGARISGSDGASTPVIKFDTIASGTATERMRIDSSGNVGIGTAIPSVTLDVNGGTNTQLRLTASDSLGMSAVNFGDQANEAVGRIIYSHVDDSLSFKTNNVNDRFTIDSSGNVGIGTATPSYTLEVKKDVNSWVSRIYNTGSDSSASGLLVRTDATAAHDTHAFGVYADGGYRFSVRSNGNVGIGTSSPAYGFVVANQKTANSASGAMYLAANANGTGKGLVIDSSTRTSSDASVLALEVKNRAGSNTMAATVGGNVGIGTTSPNTLLHVTSPSGNGDGTVFIENTLATYGMGLKVKGGGNVDNERFALQVQNAVGDDILFAQSLTGNVGIGTASPTAKLEVSGGDIKCSNQIRAKGWYTTDSGAGRAMEMGISGGIGYMMNYDRDANSYGEMRFQCGINVLKIGTGSDEIEISTSSPEAFNTVYHTGNLPSIPTVSSTSQRIKGPTGNYGSVRVTATAGGYAGYAIQDDWVFMSSNAAHCGIYNDTDNEWGTLWNQNGSTDLYHNGSLKVQTSSAGLIVTGSVYASAGMLAVQGAGSGGLNWDSSIFAGITGMWGVSNSGYSHVYTRSGNTINLTFTIQPMGSFMIDAQGYVAFTNLPFAPYSPAAGPTKYVGTWTVNNVAYANAKVCTIQDGKLYLWAGSSNTSIVALSDAFIGTITYDI